ncbi:MAG: NADH-quinone oxidoreductase subunit NuoE [Acidobacteria bacterium]|jgi:NADH-quinone oxidoreductase subunit E|nr:NADH-quinone oxidoreductase subunit NuoE [Acidobacteriota bacterium]
MQAHRKYDFRNQSFEGEQGRLIPLLQAAQEQEGYLSREGLLRIQRESGIPLAQIYGVATFYAQFRLKPVGRHLIRVCHGTACHVSGAVELTQAIGKHLQIGNGETTADRMFTLETVSCLGCCSLAPALMIGNATYGNLSPSSAIKLLKKYQKGDHP